LKIKSRIADVAFDLQTFLHFRRKVSLSFNKPVIEVPGKQELLNTSVAINKGGDKRLTG